MSIHQPYATARQTELRATAEHRRLVVEARDAGRAADVAAPRPRRNLRRSVAWLLRPAV